MRPVELAATPTTQGASESVRPTPTDGEGERSPIPEEGPGGETLVRVGDVTDEAGDPGVTAPAYADLRRVTVEASRETARFVVVLGGSLPSRPEAGEVIGIGIDLYSPGADEGSYQLFADGGEGGWFAYLHTPDGFARYQGSFSIDAERIVFTVPWSALGGLREGGLRAFCDWSRRGVVTESSEDAVPDSGVASYGA